LVLAIFTVIMPLGVYVAFKRARLALFNPVVENHSDGSVEQRWVMKPVTRRMLNRVRRPADVRKRPGLATASELKKATRIKEVPTEYRGAVIHELDGEPPLELKLLMTPER
jgi:hypothetical protein